MSDGYDNELKGALFRNKQKREGKRDPDHKGTATIAGVEYWVSGWINTSKAGDKYLGLSFQVKESKPQAPTAPAEPDPFLDDDIDSIPI